MTDGPVLSRADVRELDRRAIEELGIPSCVLMENAGRACAEVARELVGDAAEPTIVLAGPGNNGGDGFVIARTLANHGFAVAVVFVGPRATLAASTGDVATNLRLWVALGGEVRHVEDLADVEALRPALASAPLVVDALFGTGLTRALSSPWLETVRAVNASGARVLAVDLPSGLDADTGEVLSDALRAEVTVTFVAPKPGFLRGRGPELCGRVVVAEIGIPRAWIPSTVSRSS